MCKLTYLFHLSLFCILLSCKQSPIEWTVVLHQPGKAPSAIGSFSGLPEVPLFFEKEVDRITVEALFEKMDGQYRFSIKARSEAPTACYLSLVASGSNNQAQLYAYSGAVTENQTFRQSPHDPSDHSFKTLVKQDIPMLAIKDAATYYVAISNTPALYDNYTTQTYDVVNRSVELSSGDHGKPGGADPSVVKIEEHYHTLDQNNPHVFEGILFETNAATINDFQKDVLLAIAARWEPRFKDRFGATSFSSNYMLLRKNETGNSDYWVVPGIAYANKQYSRDAFWQSMILPAKYRYQCYLNEANALTTGAERPLFLMLWTYRAKLEGSEPDLEAARKTLAYIEGRTQEGWYYAAHTNSTKNLKSWYDMVEFDEDDVLTYNQGLLAVALMAAEALGLEPKTTSTKAISNYQSMYKDEKGYFPLSRKKDLLAVDVFTGDLLAQLYFGKALLREESVHAHFQTIVANAKTDYGYKVTSLANGDYAPLAYYSSEDKKNKWYGEGSYQWGGSWYLYDMLFLLNSYLHDAPNALDEIKWRASLDFRIGGTYFEHTHTQTGIPRKSNQGWNASIYAMWNTFIENDLADDSLLQVIDAIQ
ncbi:hypothetical protein SAMN05192553_11278 [Cyclobacterium xiamenense]|uniref:Uncharacterized protein n=1 Tax=Cyclobacterium xiamenense TaxID=1297121 RepID=A0A1H7BKN3_9BACT|nr:hypothetical protein [Cyclobacterium xiamenense]SEJ77776.1 hypothetical protein SAMN05192553_11278 [Cyclobacterium xiamenense]